MNSTLSATARRVLASAAVLALLLGCQSTSSTQRSLRSSLLFEATFDQGPDADLSTGDRRLYHAPNLNDRDNARPGLPPDGLVEIARGAGVHGDALRFVRTGSPIVYFSADGNTGYRTKDWSGTVSFWLKVNPAAELAEGFCDPIQLTSKSWDNAAFFCEFEKRPSGIPFRLGVYPDFPVWNPTNRKWEDMSAAEKPLLSLPNPPFRGDRWTHVVFTFEHFNTGRADGVARLYLDGVPAGSIPARTQTFTWDPLRARILLGVGYVGLWDELAVFNRALTPGEIQALHQLPGGIGDLGH